MDIPYMLYMMEAEGLLDKEKQDEEEEKRKKLLNEIVRKIVYAFECGLDINSTKIQENIFSQVGISDITDEELDYIKSAVELKIF